MDGIHLVNDLYSFHFIGRKLNYGSPGYPMTFIPRSIKQINETEFEFEGDMPQATIGTENHFFIIDDEHLEELEMNGETYWIAKDGAHIYLSF